MPTIKDKYFEYLQLEREANNALMKLNISFENKDFYFSKK